MRTVPIVALAVMAACIGQVTGRAFGSVGPSAGVVLAGAAGFSAALIATVRPEGAPGVTWRRLEIVAYPIAAVTVVGISNGETRLAPTVVAVTLVLFVRTLVESTIVDLAMIDRILDDRPTGAPPDRIRLRMLGVGVLLASVAGYTLGVDAGFTDLSRPAVGGQLLAVVVWFAVGIAGTGAVSRRFRRRAWKLNDVEASDGIWDRWAAGVAGAVALVTIVAIGVPLVSGQLSAAPAQVISDTDGLDRFVTRALEFFSRDGGAGDSDRTAGDDENRGSFTDALEPQTSDRPSWIGDVVLTAIIATVFLWAIRAGRNARLRRGGPPVGSGGWDGIKELLAALVSEFAGLFAGLFTWLRRVGRRRRSQPPGNGTGRPTSTEHIRSRWSPADGIERRIARSFASVVDFEPKRAGETPGEVTRRIGERSDATGARTVLDGYLLARYSPHPVEERLAADVEAAADKVTEALDDRPEAVGNSGTGTDPEDG